LAASFYAHSGRLHHDRHTGLRALQIGPFVRFAGLQRAGILTVPIVPQPAGRAARRWKKALPWSPGADIMRPFANLAVAAAFPGPIHL